MVFADLLARTWRLQWLVLGVGSRISFAESFRINLYAEAGASLTPMRVGGEPARLAGMLGAGVPATASFVAIAYEVITAWPGTAMIVRRPSSSRPQETTHQPPSTGLGTASSVWRSRLS